MLHFLTLFKFLFNFVNNLLIRYPLPKNIGYMWNTFFFFMIAFVIQLFTGLFLAMFYFNYILYMFLNIIKKRIYINYLEMNLILFYYIYNILWCALVSWATLNKLEQKLKLGFVYYLLSYAQTINNTTSEWFSMFQTFYTPHFFSIFLHERKYDIPLRYKHSSFKYNNNSLSKRYYSISHINAHFNFTNNLTQSKFQRNKKKSICSKRFYSTSHFNKWHNKIIIKKKIPKFLKDFYYNFFYYYYFRFKYSIYVSSIYYKSDFLYLNVDEDVLNPHTTNFYYTFMNYDSLDVHSRLSFVNIYIDYLLDYQRDVLFFNYGETYNLPVFRYQSVLNNSYHSFVFKYPNGIYFFISWMYILKTEVLKYFYINRYVNIIVCFYTSSYNNFYYYSEDSIYNFKINCSFTYDSELDDIHSNSNLSTLIKDFLFSKYNTSKSSMFRYPLYKLLSSLELDKVKGIHFNFSDLDVVYDQMYSNKNKNTSLFKTPKVVRKYSTFLLNKNRIIKQTFSFVRAFYMKKFLKYLKVHSTEQDVLIKYIKHPVLINTSDMKMKTSKQEKDNFSNIQTESGNALLKANRIEKSDVLSFKTLTKKLDLPHYSVFLECFGVLIIVGYTSSVLPPHFNFFFVLIIE